MAEPGGTINLKILSPSTEIEGGIFLPDLPVSTTIKGLRQKIHDAAPSKPATNRMRLIYRGRVVANDDDKLADVFPVEELRASKEQSLHLVLRELPDSATASSPAPRSSTAPPNPFRPAPGPPQSPLQTNPFRALPQPRPQSQPQVPPLHHHHHPNMHHHHHHRPPGAPSPQLQQMEAQAAQLRAELDQRRLQELESLQVPRGTLPPPGEGPRPPASAASPQPPNTTRTIRQEGIGPNGERWTVTWNNTNFTIPIPAGGQQPILPRPFPHPPTFALPGQRAPSPSGNRPEQILARIRVAMDFARQEANNVRVLLQPTGGQNGAESALAAANPPPWRVDQIRLAVRNLVGGLDNIDRALSSIVADPLMAQNRDLVSLQQSITELRSDAVDFTRILANLRGTSSSSTSATPATPSAPITGTNSAAATHTQTPSEFPPELFILSSPQGPVGMLFDQRGVYTTPPMASTLPFQTFSQHFATNRQIIAGIGQQIAQNAFHTPNSQGAPQPVQAQQPAAGAQPGAAPQQIQNQAQNQAQNAPQNRPAAPEQDRVALVAGHLWLLFKLACFVYFFAGGGGWYRPIALGLIAGIVYLAQIGLFDAQFAIVRRHFEALLPLAERAAQPPNAANGAQGVRNRRVEPGRNLSPQEAAQRLVQQRQDQRFGWIRETMRSTERAFAIFVASLWPGIGERMVQAQEERERAERAAEEERQRQREEEETRRQEQEKKDAEKAEDTAVEARPAEGSSDATSSSKGKERAVDSEAGA